MGKWIERYGVGGALILICWLVFQQIKDLVLLRSDLKAMSQAMAKLGPVEVPALTVHFAVQSLAVLVIAMLAAPAIVGIWQRTWKRRFDRRQVIQSIRHLFFHMSGIQIEWIKEFMEGSKWSRARPPGTLAQRVTQVLDQRSARGDQYSMPGRLETDEEFLYRINPKARFALRWRIWVRDFQENRKRRVRIAEAVRRADREERTVLWLFWRGPATGLRDIWRKLNEPISRLERRGVVDRILQRGYGVGIRLDKDAVKPTEKYILNGKRIRHREIRTD